MNEKVLRDQASFKDAGGTWEDGAIQWVGYFDPSDEGEIRDVAKPWVDFTLLAHSQEQGDSRLATKEDLRLLGYVDANAVRDVLRTWKEDQHPIMSEEVHLLIVEVEEALGHDL